MNLGQFVKQPDDVLDYDVDYSQWLNTDDHVVSAQVEVEPSGLSVQSSHVFSSRVNIWLSGGTAGNSHKVTVTATTSVGRVRQDEFRVKIKEF